MPCLLRRFHRNAMFSWTCNIASASAFYPSRPQKNPHNYPHFTHLKIRRSADPHFTGGRTWLAVVHRANAARCEEAVTSLARTSCRWPLDRSIQHLLQPVLSSLSAHTPGERYSNRRSKLQMHGWVWLQVLHPLSAENAEADVANENMTRWQWRRVDPGCSRTKALHPANGRDLKLF